MQFDIHLADGRTVPVEHPEMLALRASWAHHWRGHAGWYD